MGDFTMPSLGADMDRGRLTEWLVAAGDRVHRGDLVAVVQTDKSDIEVEVFEDGVIEALLVEPGAEVAVGTPLARIAPAEPAGAAEVAGRRRTGVDGPAPAPVARAPVAAPPVVLQGPGRTHPSVILSPLVRHLAADLHVDAGAVTGTGVGGRVTRADVEHAAHRRTPGDDHVRASPRARRLAAERGIDLGSVSGTGPAGAVRERDLPAPEPATPAAPAERRAAMRAAIARSMSRANREIPHYHVLETIDLGAALAWLGARNADHGPAERILPAALLLRATAVAAVAVPECNGWWREDGPVVAERVDLGTAVSLRGGGLVTVTLADAGALDLPATMAALRGLVARARAGTLRGRDVAEASLTVTNLGDRGAEAVLGIIQPPQVALVGFGRITDTVVARDGAPAVRPCTLATLSGDHRATDGHAGSRFLAAVADALSRPEEL